MNKKNIFKIYFVFLCGLFLACSSNNTDTQKNMASFASSLCKKKASENNFSISSLYHSFAENQVPGLKCISWKKTATSLYLDLFNFEQACGTLWEGSIELEDNNKLILNIENPSSAVANCGWCTFDWSFEAINIDLEQDKELLVKIDTHPNGSNEYIKFYNAQLNTASADSGILCQWANWHALYDMAMTLGISGTLHMPCNESAQTLCEENLVCEKAHESHYQEICISPCTQDSDCLNEEILSCQDGFCLLRSIWEP